MTTRDKAAGGVVRAAYGRWFDEQLKVIEWSPSQLTIWRAAVEWTIGEYDKIPCTCGAGPDLEKLHDLKCAGAFARAIAARIRTDD